MKSRFLVTAATAALAWPIAAAAERAQASAAAQADAEMQTRSNASVRPAPLTTPAAKPSDFAGRHEFDVKGIANVPAPQHAVGRSTIADPQTDRSGTGSTSGASGDGTLGGGGSTDAPPLGL